MEIPSVLSSSSVHYGELGEEGSICDESYGLFSMATFCRSQRYILPDPKFMLWDVART